MELSEVKLSFTSQHMQKALGIYVKTFVNCIECYFILSNAEPGNPKSCCKNKLGLDDAEMICQLFRVDKDRFVKLVNRCFLRAIDKDIYSMVGVQDYIVGIMREIGFSNYEFPVYDTLLYD